MKVGTGTIVDATIIGAVFDQERQGVWRRLEFVFFQPV